jgi:hypothetical protein
LDVGLLPWADDEINLGNGRLEEQAACEVDGVAGDTVGAGRG